MFSTMMLLLCSISFAETASIKSAKPIAAGNNGGDRQGVSDYLNRANAIIDDWHAQTKITKQRILKEGVARGDQYEIVERRYYGKVRDLTQQHKEQFRALVAPQICGGRKSIVLNFLDAWERMASAFADAKTQEADKWKQKAMQYSASITNDCSPQQPSE